MRERKERRKEGRERERKEKWETRPLAPRALVSCRSTQVKHVV